mmetsp:Transcript_11894/g.36690  ORF Transcript_11894/g.36690 Transcript_11894/m.36690 type:complete len:199 (-) Transcript_11894:539-1135(-)
MRQADDMQAKPHNVFSDAAYAMLKTDGNMNRSICYMKRGPSSTTDTPSRPRSAARRRCRGSATLLGAWRVHVGGNAASSQRPSIRPMPMLQRCFAELEVAPISLQGLASLRWLLRGKVVLVEEVAEQQEHEADISIVEYPAKHLAVIRAEAWNIDVVPDEDEAAHELAYLHRCDERLSLDLIARSSEAVIGVHYGVNE